MLKNEPITVMAHIELRHQGCISQFADKHNTTRQTVYNWIAVGAMWWQGQVWLPRLK